MHFVPCRSELFTFLREPYHPKSEENKQKKMIKSRVSLIGL